MTDLISWITGLDFAILDFIQNNMRSAFLDAVFPYVTHLGDGGAVWIALALALICIKRYRRDGITAAVALILCLLFCNLLIKNIAARTRPFDINTSIELLIGRPSDYSFPSGHTTAAFAAAASLLLCKNRKTGVPALILAVIVSYTRLYFYVHYPSDVLGGVVLGILNALAAYVIVNFIYKWRAASL